MQNLIKYLKGRYKVTRNVFELCSKYHTGDDPIYNLKCAILRHSREMKNFSRPKLYYEFKYMSNEFQTISRVVMRTLYGLTTISSKHRWNGIRNYSRDAKDNPDDRNNPSSQKPSGNPPERPPIFHIVSFFLIAYLFLQVMKMMDKSSNSEDEYKLLQGRWISWSEFVHQILMKGEVKDIVIYKENAVITTHEGAIIKGRMGPINRYFLPISDWQTMEEKVRKIEHDIGITPGNGVPIIYDRKDETITTFLMLFVCAVLLVMFSVLRKKQLTMKPWEFISNMGKAKFTLVDSLSRGGKGVRFEDVAGLKEAKMEVMEFVDYLKQPERYKALGAKVPKGALLLGPPGCGKTLLAKAVATEADVPFMSMNGSEFIEVFGGLGAARVRDLFKEGKKRAPSIIYIDEIDAIGKKRSEGGAELSNGESDRTLNQLLVEMDGMVSKENVIILASTNRAEVLDKALLRPGRFDRHILIDFPTLEERRQIFESHLKRISLKSEPSRYSGSLAHLTPGFSGADIANVCNEAALHAARDRKRYVDGSDLMYAIDRTIGGVAKKNSTMTPNEKQVVAYHEAGHTIVGWLLKHTDALLKVSIVPRTNLRLGFSQYTQKNQFLRSKEELFDQMCVMLGGRAAENMTFNKISTSAENDLKKVTQLAYQQVQQYGMSPTVGLISFDEEVTSTKTRKIYSKKLASIMDIEARRIITEAYRASEKLLKDNEEKLKLVAEELLKRETLTYDCIEKLIGSPPHGKKRLVEHGVFDEIIADVPQPSTT